MEKDEDEEVIDKLYTGRISYCNERTASSIFSLGGTGTVGDDVTGKKKGGPWEGATLEGMERVVEFGVFNGDTDEDDEEEEVSVKGREEFTGGTLFVRDNNSCAIADNGERFEGT